jgi:Mat/Ecp fimbriae outer membrane usher protein
MQPVSTVLATALSMVCAVPAGANAADVQRVPPGFEDIARGQVEQLEIRLLDRSLGVFPVRVGPDEVSLEQPEAVLTAIDVDSEQLVGKQQAIIAALSAPMARNGHLVCPTAGLANGCGYLDTQTAAVIFNESEGTLDLFLNKSWLPRPAVDDDLYRSPSNGAENAFVHRQTMNFTSGRTYRNLSVTGAGALGIMTDGFVGMNWTMVNAQSQGQSDTRLFFDNLYYRYDLGRRYYGQIGRMDQRYLSSSLGGNFGFAMLPLGPFDGVRVGTTQAYLNRNTVARGTPVVVMLPRSARIDAYRGNQLLGTFYLDAGVNTLDTAGFPEGRYAVELRIFESDVLSRTEIQQFSKSGGDFADRRVQWFVQSGRQTDDDRSSDADTDVPTRFSAQAGVRIPLPFDLALTSGVAAIGGNAYNETRFDWRLSFPNATLDASAAFFAGNDGSRGNTQLINFNNGVSWMVSRYQLRGASCDNTRYSTASDIGCYDSLSATVSFPVAGWQATTAYSFNRTLGRRLSYGMTRDGWLPARPDADRRSGDNVSRALQVALSRSFKWRSSMVSMRVGAYYAQNGGNQPNDTGVLASVTLSAASQPPTASGMTTFTSAGVDLRTVRSGDMQVGYNANRTWNWQNGTNRELALDLNGYRDETLSGSMRGRVDGRYGNLSMTAGGSYSRLTGGINPSFNGTYASSLAIGSRGMFIGPDAGQGEPAAALAVAVESHAEDRAAAAELVVNGMRPVTLAFGSRVMTPIEGFSATTADVRDVAARDAAATASVSSGGGMRHYFLMPGKIINRSVGADVTFTYVGRLLGPNGAALAGARLLNAPSAATDDDGGFLVELTYRPDTLYAVTSFGVLRCPMKVKARQDVVMLTGAIQCAPIDRTALPAKLRKQPYAQRLLKAVPATHAQLNVSGAR